MIDKRTLEKYEKEAKEAGRDSWYLSWALDTNAEERAKVCLDIHNTTSSRSSSSFLTVGLTFIAITPT